MPRLPLRLAVIALLAGCGGSSTRGPVVVPGQVDSGQDAAPDAPLPINDAGDGSFGSDPIRDVGSEVAVDATTDVAVLDAAADTTMPRKPAYIIDDMERADMSARFESPAGAQAQWSAVANFAVGQQALSSASAIIRRLDVPQGNSERAAMLAAPVLEDGADLFVELRPLPGAVATGQHVDFSRFTGIAFWARLIATAPRPGAAIAVAIKDDRYPINDEEFWSAELMGTPWFSVVLPSGQVWQRHEVRFEQFRQGMGSGDAGPRVHTNAIASIHFLASPRVPFELWIDDLVLTCDGPCPGEDPGPRVCTPGLDQTCNDSPVISSLHGMCTAAGVCICRPGFAKNPATGKCL